MTASAPKTVSSKTDRRRRRHPRYPESNLRVNVSYLQHDQYRRLEGACRDISEAGMGILLAAELSVGEVAGLTFRLTGSSALWEVRAVIRYRRGYHYGFEFLSLKGEHQEFLKNYVKPLQPLD